ncbi:hypothetical protein [Paenibacillus sp. IITD108]|uniref:hypothetical protein n=1 Tax=Paenibacillus sp. IITD108 TaxID=3116649 RepID=UPI002F3F978C
MFSINFDEFTCFKKRTGTCSLLLTEVEFKEYDLIDNSSNDRNTVHYCPNILKIMLKKGTAPIDAHLNLACGHIGMIDGQHRSCISKIKQMQLPAKMRDYNTYCSVCDNDARFYLI